ncbi:MAG: thioredoxin-dependent thiol peroxidase [Candidatus Anstonellaceae archaeon]
MLAEGNSAPDFSLPDSSGKLVKLSNFAGKFVVLYFYPKDDTPGCTTEACGFRDMMKEYGEKGIVILGISPDSPESHAKFAKKYKLPFTLLADVGAKVAQKYGVWGEKQMMGRHYMGIFRTTFVIGKSGKIEKVFEGVKPEGHEKEVLEWIEKAH